MRLFLALLLIECNLFSGQKCAIDSASTQSSIICTFGLNCASAGGCTGTATPTTAGSAILCHVLSTGSNPSSGASGLTDPSSQTYTAVPQHPDAHWFQEQSYRINSASIATVTSTPSGFGAIVLACEERTETVTALDQSAGHDNGFTGSPCSGCAYVTGTTGATTQNNEIVVSSCGNSTANAPTALTAPSGWTKDIESQDDANVTFISKTVSATGTQAGSGVYSNTSGGGASDVVCIIATYKITVAAGAGGSKLSGRVTLSGSQKVQEQ